MIDTTFDTTYDEARIGGWFRTDGSLPIVGQAVSL